MKTSVAGLLVGWGAGLLLWGGLVGSAAAQPIPVSACGTLVGGNSYILTADLKTSAGVCLTVTANGASINLNGHSIAGQPGATAGILAATPGNNMTITGPGIVHDFITCIDLGNYALVQDVLAYNCEFFGIRLSNFSKCVECRVHDVRSSEVDGVGIQQGLGCLLESSIVERSDVGAIVGSDCKVWDLVVDTVLKTGLTVSTGTSVARTVISHYHDGPGLDYRNCSIVTPATAGSSRLFGATGSNQVNATLYSIDPSTGASTVIGPVTVGTTHVSITGLAFHPSTHVLFAVTGGNSDLRLSGHLLTIDPSTGAATDVGSMGISLDCSGSGSGDGGGPVVTVGNVGDISFRADGTLFGFGPCGPSTDGNLYTINLTTGAASFVGAVTFSGDNNRGYGLSFLPLTSTPQPLFGFPQRTDQNMYVINPANGAILQTIALSGGSSDTAINALTSDPSGALLLGVKTDRDNPATTSLVAINSTTGAITVRGALPGDMDALALDPLSTSTLSACQDSSNSVSLSTGGGPAILDAPGRVVTDCATNAGGARYQGNPTTQCPNPTEQ